MHLYSTHRMLHKSKIVDILSDLCIIISKESYDFAFSHILRKKMLSQDSETIIKEISNMEDWFVEPRTG
jgi:hypothetical protein